MDESVCQSEGKDTSLYTAPGMKGGGVGSHQVDYIKLAKSLEF